MTDSMEAAIEETQRRREIQLKHNEEHGYEAATIDKPVSETNLPGSKTDTSNVSVGDVESAEEAKAQIEALEDRMDEAASNLSSSWRPTSATGSRSSAARSSSTAATTAFRRR